MGLNWDEETAERRRAPEWLNNLRDQKKRIIERNAEKKQAEYDEAEAERLRKEIRELGEKPCA